MWIRAEGRRNVKIPELKKEDIWRCSICTYVYVDAGENELSTCPRCSSINKRANTK
jgi:rubrerythrin